MEDKITKLEQPKYEQPWVFDPLPAPAPAVMTEEEKDRKVRLRHRKLLPQERIDLFKTRTNTQIHATICVFREFDRKSNNASMSFNELWDGYGGLYRDATKTKDRAIARAACRDAFYKLEYKNKDERLGYEIAECVSGDRT